MEHKEEQKAELELDNTLIETTHKVESLYITYKKQINMGLLVVLVAIGGYIGFNKFYLEPLEKRSTSCHFSSSNIV
jgi:hypothetical protein